MLTVRADTKPLGGIAGCAKLHPDILQNAANTLKRSRGDIFTDSFVTHIGNRLVILTVFDTEKEEYARNIIKSVMDMSERLSDERGFFKGEGKESSAYLSFKERDCEQIIMFLAGTDDENIWEKFHGSSSAKAVMLCRAEGEFESTAELCEYFADSKLCPVSLCEGGVVRTKVFPVVGLGFSMHGGKLCGPVDLFDSPLFASAVLRSSNQ